VPSADRRFNSQLAPGIASSGSPTIESPTCIEASFGRRCQRPTANSPSNAPGSAVRRSCLRLAPHPASFGCPGMLLPGLRLKISSECASGQFPACAVRSGSSALLAIQLLACAANCLLRVCRRCILWLAPLAASSDLPAIPGGLAPQSAILQLTGFFRSRLAPNPASPGAPSTQIFGLRLQPKSSG